MFIKLGSWIHIICYWPTWESSGRQLAQLLWQRHVRTPNGHPRSLASSCTKGNSHLVEQLSWYFSDLPHRQLFSEPHTQLMRRRQCTKLFGCSNVQLLKRHVSSVIRLFFTVFTDWYNVTVNKNDQSQAQNRRVLLILRSTQPSILHGTVKWVPAKGRWCSAAEKVTACLAES